MVMPLHALIGGGINPGALVAVFVAVFIAVLVIRRRRRDGQG
jgi:hydrogenase-4 membrane subunit HyfE